MAIIAWSSLLVLILTLAVIPVDGASGGSGNAGAPAPSVDCTDALPSLAGCLSYVQEGSTTAKPDASCCSGLKQVVKKEVSCLCQAFQSGQNFGVNLNMTKALELPSACKVKTPPFSKCHISSPGVNGQAPAGAPASGPLSSGESPTPLAPSPSTAGSESAHAPSPSHSAAASLPASSRLSFASVAASLLAYYYLL